MDITNDIRPFRVAVPQADVDDLSRRLAAARWPEPSPDERSGFDRGIPLGYLRRLAGYWRTGFDWRAQEARLNELPQHLTDIGGQTIHFLHVRSSHDDALPLLLAHGYPGSVVEFTKLVGPLTDPAAHGGAPADAFHLVVPSLPGFGFSSPVRETGWEIGRTTEAFAVLMERLGYGRYGVHGGDIGAGVAGRLAATRPERVTGVLIASDRGTLGLAGEQFPVPDDLTGHERARLDEARARWAEERGYLDLQSHRPETIAAGLTDSAVGQLAWIAEKFQTWTNPSSATPDEAVDRDQLLTLVSLYWYTRTGASAARFLAEAAHADLDWVAPSAVPTGWAVFNTDPLVRRIMDPEKTVPFWSEHEQGGHFPAMETPDLLVEDLRDFFRQLR